MVFLFITNHSAMFTQKYVLKDLKFVGFLESQPAETLLKKRAFFIMGITGICH